MGIRNYVIKVNLKDGRTSTRGANFKIKYQDYCANSKVFVINLATDQIYTMPSNEVMFQLVYDRVLNGSILFKLEDYIYVGLKLPPTAEGS